MLRRSKKEACLEICFVQKNKWDKEWTRHWLYVKTSGVTSKKEPKVTRYPLASTMKAIKPICLVSPSKIDVA